MPKSSAQIEVLCAPEDFLSVLGDFESYPEFVDEMKEVELLSGGADEGQARVRFVLELNVMGQAIKSEYTLDYTFGDDTLSWTLVESENLTRNEGQWRIEAVDNDECIAHYEATVETNLPIPPDVQKMVAEQEIPRMLETFRERAEELYD